MFRIQFFDRGKKSLALIEDRYDSALRTAKSELLGTGGDHAEITHNGRVVALATRQYRKVGTRGSKFSVLISGEKPRKA
jgi:hypothetical protein